MDEVTLHLRHLMVSQMLPKYGLEGLTKVELRSYLEPIARGMVLKLRAYVYEREIPPIVARYPANWIEAIKDRWLPQWAKKRWPVRFTEVSTEAHHLYPKLAIQDHTPLLHVALMDPKELLDYGDRLIYPEEEPEDG